MLRHLYDHSRRKVIVVLLSATFVCVSVSAFGIGATAFSSNAPGNQETARAATLEEAKRLNDQARKLYSEGRYDESISLVERVLTTLEKVLDPEHSDVVESLNNLAMLYAAKGNYAKAEPLFQRVLATREKKLGPDSTVVAVSLGQLGALYFSRMEYAKAEPLYNRALAIFEKSLGPDHLYVANALSGLATLYRARVDYAKAEQLYQRALAIQEKSLGPEHSDVAATLLDLAVLYKNNRDFAKAEPLFQRALTVREKSQASDQLGLASSLHHMADLYRAMGNYAKAEPLYQRALAIRESADSLSSLALLYQAKGDYEKAEPLYQRALVIREKSLGPDDPGVAISLHNLAFLYWARGDYQNAEPLYQRALAIYEKAMGREHPYVAASLENLAVLYNDMGNYQKAEPLYHRALAIYEKLLMPDHPNIANSLNNLAGLYNEKGDYQRAESLYQRALAAYEKTVGPDHPDVAGLLDNLAFSYRVRDKAKAIALLTRASNISEYNISLNLASGSERQKRLFLATLEGQTNAIVSIHIQFASNDLAARRLALLTVLRRKGRALDAMVDTVDLLRRRLDPQDKTMLDQLTEVRSRLAALVLGGPGESGPVAHRAEIKRLEEEVDKLESQISGRSAEFRAATQPVTLEAVQSAIPAAAALVEFISYRPLDPKENRAGEPRYAVYVVRNKGEPLWADLGQGKEIDDAVESLRTVLPPNEDGLRDIESEVRPLARAVDERVMRPVRKMIGNAQRLLIVPDGSLNLVPFAALVDERKRYLVEQYTLTYLTSGRDLLRRQSRGDSGQGPVIIANPEFGGDLRGCYERGFEHKKDAAQPKVATVFPQGVFCPLPGTAGEAEALKKILPTAHVITEGRVTKSAIKQVRGPMILHVATHGFFLEDVFVGSAQTGGRGMFIGRKSERDNAAQSKRVDPLLRSGLALSGANLRRGADDGILTALEVAGLDLWGTKLVVLSACETGVGEVHNWDGVHGLRRALVLAGSEAQMMSLWKVDDDGTRDLMIDYYKGLQAGHGRSEALRRVQLRMLRNEDGAGRVHPYFWASFIQSGEWSNLGRKP